MKQDTLTRVAGKDFLTVSVQGKAQTWQSRTGWSLLPLP